MNSLCIQSIPQQFFRDLFARIDFCVQLPQIDFYQLYHNIEFAVAKPWQWRDHAIQQLHAWDHTLDTIMPNFPIQDRIDQLIEELEQKFAPLVTFNHWLNSNGHGDWYEQLAQFLAKLPLRSARNIIQQLYLIIKGVVYGVVHPLKALNKLAQLLVLLPFDLTKPEIWSQMGAGMIGSSLGDAVIMGGFLSLVGLGVGGAMLLAGVSIGTLKASLQAKEGEWDQAAAQYLLQQSAQLSENLVTGFYMGLIMGGIRKAIQEHEARVQKEHIEREQQMRRPNGRELYEAQSARAADFFDVVEQCRANPDGYPPIAYAVKLGRHDVVKFFIDNKESINATTPDIAVWRMFYYENSPDTPILAGTQPGYTPLELAIQKNDTEMVKILTTYNPSNAAPVSGSVHRFNELYLHRSGDSFMASVDHPRIVSPWGTISRNQGLVSTVVSPLSLALAGGNEEIIASVIKAYPIAERYGLFVQIHAMQQANIMRIWLEQTALLQGISGQITDETARLFISRSLQEGIVDIAKIYLQQGVSCKELLFLAVEQKQLSTVEQLLELVNYSQNEIQEAVTKAYQSHTYQIMELLQTKL